MRFWRVTFYDEPAPDCYTRHYFTSRRQALKFAAELRKEYREQTAEATARQEAGELYPGFPVFDPKQMTIAPVDIADAPKKVMILAALRCGG